MVGVGTVLADDPLLTCRLEGGKNPVRVICDTRLRTPLDSRIVNKVMAYIAPKLFGGAAAKSPVGGLGVELPAQAVRLKNSVVTRIGDDFLIESEVDTDVHRDR